MINIRPITEADFANLIELFKALATFQKDPEKMINSVAQMVAEKELIHGFVAISERDEIIGYTTYFYAYYSWVGKSLHLDDLYIKPTYRNKGIGSKLIQSVIDHAKATNCKKVGWQVSNWNHPAIDFYKTLGATVDDSRSDCEICLM